MAQLIKTARPEFRQVRIHSSEDAPHSGSSLQVEDVKSGIDLGGATRDITIHAPLDGLVTATIEIIPKIDITAVGVFSVCCPCCGYKGNLPGWIKEKPAEEAQP